MGNPFKCTKCDSLLCFCQCNHPMAVDVFDEVVTSDNSLTRRVIELEAEIERLKARYE